MAIDWIKMRTNLQTHPKIVRILSATQTDKFRVIGGLHAVWSVFDAHSSDGRLDGYTPEALDHIIGWTGFSRALVAVGWLHESDGPSLEIPDFSEHNGQSGKRRAEDQKRKRDSRNAPKDERTDCGQIADKDRQKSGLEKKRKEYSVSKDTAAKDRVWTIGPALLGEGARGLLGKLVAQYGEDVLADVLSAAATEEPGEPKAWIVKACEVRSKQQAQAAKLGGYAELFADPKPRWALDAGFANRFEANNDGCFEHNAAQFRDGKKVSA